MPFITQKRRALYPSMVSFDKNIQKAKEGGEPGDLCFLFYRCILNEFNKEPRWTTVHRLCTKLRTIELDDENEITALSLAWQVFFFRTVMPYEMSKKKENGDIK